MMKTQLIRLTLLEGDADGLRTAEIAGRTTKLIACPMSAVDKLLSRAEARRPAVYFLYGQDFEKPTDAIYVGECDAVARRFNGRHHAMEKAEWRQLVAAFSSDAIFNKAHARRAEHLLAERVKAAAKVTLMTERSGEGDLDEGDASFADQFVSDVAMLAETLGFNAFRSPKLPPSTAGQLPGSVQGVNSASDVFRFIGEATLEARMLVQADDFIVLEGGLARLEETPGCNDSTRALRAKAKEVGVLVPTEDGQKLKVTRDFVVGSTSAAGGFIAGRNSRGPNEWVHISTGQTYAQWIAQKQNVAAVEGA
jgi:hypothetical protein